MQETLGNTGRREELQQYDHLKCVLQELSGGRKFSEKRVSESRIDRCSRFRTLPVGTLDDGMVYFNIVVHRCADAVRGSASGSESGVIPGFRLYKFVRKAIIECQLGCGQHYG